MLCQQLGHALDAQADSVSLCIPYMGVHFMHPGSIRKFAFVKAANAQAASA